MLFQSDENSVMGPGYLLSDGPPGRGLVCKFSEFAVSTE
jgi:hypothetical protein